MSTIVTRDGLETLIKNEDLVIRPLLEPTQITEIGIDFRLGYNFLVSVHGRDPFINTSLNDEFGNGQRDIKHFFQETRRQLGETFILYPNQTVLATSLEYVKLPNTHLLNLLMRSSYSRLGLTVSTVVQPGYCGCISVELTNSNHNPINLVVGARIFQGILYTVDSSASYFKNDRKYVCQVRPIASSANQDVDLVLLNNLWKKRNNKS